MAFSITSLLDYFKNENKSVSRGENHFKSNHIESCSYLGDGVLKGKVHASMKNKIYDVVIYLDDKMVIKSTQCDCPRGEFKCSHAAALMIHAIHHVSVTDTECSWKKGKTSDLSKTSIAELFPSKKEEYKPLKRLPNDADREHLYESLQKYGKFTGLCWLMSPEPKVKETLPVPVVETLLSCEEFVKFSCTTDQLNFFKNKMTVDRETIIQIANLTINQRNNPSWQKLRKGRLTSSNFGIVLQAKKVSPSLLKRLMGEYDLSGVKAIMWGVTNEGEAIKVFESVKNLSVQPTGLWLHESGILGASPDGIIDINAIIEVKCPYTQRDKSLDDSLNDKNFYLCKSGNKIELKKGHAYWHQIQGQLYLTKCSLCYFVVWTLKWTFVAEIYKDPAWEENLQKLEQFYFSEIYKRLVNGEI